MPPVRSSVPTTGGMFGPSSLNGRPAFEPNSAFRPILIEYARARPLGFPTTSSLTFTAARAFANARSAAAARSATTAAAGIFSLSKRISFGDLNSTKHFHSGISTEAVFDDALSSETTSSFSVPRPESPSGSLKFSSETRSASGGSSMFPASGTMSNSRTSAPLWKTALTDLRLRTASIRSL